MKNKYVTIGEVSNMTGVEAYTLRYWEDEFKLLRPVRRESGQRRYTRNDIRTIEKIKTLLYEKKFSIAGAKKQLVKEQKLSGKQINLPLNQNGPAIEILAKSKKDLLEIRDTLSEEI
ncbi:MAG: MerR family transcriptional regulator [Elusimicrobia bacterium]|jgi:DNA-binding transcriptional MerR regulator|nr:MerR family transcriptional regulator [Elusimicrobiota bacterium]